MILDLAARAVLMPVLLGQAFYLRRTVVTLPEPEGPRMGSTGNGPALRLLIIGDSSAVGLGVSHQRDALLGQTKALLSEAYTVTYKLQAQSGARTGDVLNWLQTMPDGRYDYVVTALGVNDVTKLVTMRRFLHNQMALVDGLRARFGARRILVTGLPPVGQFPLLPQPLRWILGRQAARFDRHLRALVDAREDCSFVTIDMALNETNMAADGFHPGPRVYAAWGKEVARLIRADLDAVRDHA